jgi:hypothetical protein
MKLLVIMWILTLSDLSAEKRVYEGSIDECLLNSILFNQQYKGIKYAGCYTEVRQYNFVPRD